jgi:hypothetical protein
MAQSPLSVRSSLDRFFTCKTVLLLNFYLLLHFTSINKWNMMQKFFFFFWFITDFQLESLPNILNIQLSFIKLYKIDS